MWECGLKLLYESRICANTLSLLMWECGLKLYSQLFFGEQLSVTPYVGVWIETEDRQ